MPALSTYCHNPNCCKNSSHSLETKSCKNCEMIIDGFNCKLCDGCAFDFKRCGHCGSRWVGYNESSDLVDIASLITEDPDVINDADIDDQYEKHAKSAPKEIERGWANDKEFEGEKKKVEIKYEPGNTDYIYHTHPTHGEEPSQIRALPSTQDLKTAIKSAEHGVKGLAIYNGPYYCIIEPQSKSISGTSNYENKVKNNDLEGAIKLLENMGFNVKIGMI